MAAFLKIGDIKGEATDSEHKDWVRIQSFASPMHRTIQQGARDAQRSRGETVLGDINISRELDSSSVKLQEACASGKYFKEVEIHITNEVKGKQEPYLKYKLSDAIVTSYAVNANGRDVPLEDVTINFSEAEWTYVTIDPKTGDKKGQVVGKYNPGTAKAG